MGVGGLLAALRPSGIQGVLSELAARRPVGIDASVWLYSVAHKLPCDSSDPEWARAVDGLVRRAQQIVASGAPVVVVFDCPHTSPAKAEERARRRAARRRASAEAADVDLEQTSDDDDCADAPAVPSPAYIDVHGALQDMLWAAMLRAGISCLMSQAEADHQLVMLHELGLIWAAVTVDSDLLVMGVQCVVNYEWRTGECLFIDVPFWRPVDSAWAEGKEDPLAWLVRAYEAGGDARARSALMAYACIAHSDFNKIPQIGAARAVALVNALAEQLPDYDAATFGDFLDRSATRVHAVHACYSAEPQPQLSLEQVRAGMRKAFVVFTRSFAYDVIACRERPLSLPDKAHTQEEVLILGELASDAAASDLAYGRQRRGPHGQHTLVEGATGVQRVIPRGSSVVLEIEYTWLPVEVRALFEIPDVIIRQDLEPPQGPQDFPGGFTRGHLVCWYKCVGERLPTPSLRGAAYASVKDLRRGMCRWLLVHRRPRSSTDDESDAADSSDVPRFEFVNCALRDPLGRGALLLALQHRPALASVVASRLNQGAYACPAATSTGWLAASMPGAQMALGGCRRASMASSLLTSRRTSRAGCYLSSRQAARMIAASSAGRASAL